MSNQERAQEKLQAALATLMRTLLDVGPLDRLEHAPFDPTSTSFGSTIEEARDDVSNLDQITDQWAATLAEEAEDEVKVARAASALQSVAQTLDESLRKCNFEDPMVVFSAMRLYASASIRFQAVCLEIGVDTEGIDTLLYRFVTSLAGHAVAKSHKAALDEPLLPLSIDDALDLSGTADWTQGGQQAHQPPSVTTEDIDRFTKLHEDLTTEPQPVQLVETVRVPSFDRSTISQVQYPDSIRTPELAFLLGDPMSPLLRAMEPGFAPDTNLLFFRVDLVSIRGTQFGRDALAEGMIPVNMAWEDLGAAIDNPDRLEPDSVQQYFQEVVFESLGEVTVGDDPGRCVFVEVILDDGAYHIFFRH